MPLNAAEQKELNRLLKKSQIREGMMAKTGLSSPLNDSDSETFSFVHGEVPSMEPQVSKRTMVGPFGQSNQAVTTYGGYGASEQPTPFPSDAQHHHLSALPEGVPNVEMWGRAVIAFGAYKGKNVSYLDLVMSNEQEHKEHVSRYRARTKSAKGPMKDFCEFMADHFDGQDEYSGLVIPGTAHPRIYKK